MKEEHEHKVLAEKETETLLTYTGRHHAESKNTDMLIQFNLCPDCNDIQIVFCVEKQEGEFINLQIPIEAVENALNQFRQAKK
jgi:hypothetical protein